MYVTLAILFVVALVAGIVAHKRGKDKTPSAPEVDYGDWPKPPPPNPRNDPPGSPGNPIP